MLNSTTYLLGAGASVEAGIPASKELTKRILDHIRDADLRNDLPARALSMVIGAIIAHDTARGSMDFDSVDVERVFAAVRMIANRDDLELSPFVSAWNPYLDQLDEGPQPRLPPFWYKDMQESLLSTRNNRYKLERAFKEGVLALTGKESSGETFSRLELSMLSALQHALAVGKDQVSYLYPLLERKEDGPIRIATLNYDRSIELLCDRESLRVDSGIENWSGGFDWYWEEPTDVQLLKLHGSLDWYFENSRDRSDPLADDSVRVWVPSDDLRRPPSPRDLAVVFGEGSKLKADGPFLAMLREFERFLKVTDHLVVVGYSMRDDHINSAIRRWVSSCIGPRITIIDPYPPSRRSRVGSRFYQYLIADNGLAVTNHSLEVELIQESAGKGLLELAQRSSAIRLS